MKSFVLVVLVLIAGSIFATNVSGDVSGTWDFAGSPYRIVGDTNIPIDEVLTIEAGVIVVFDDYYEFRIRGQLLVNGTSENKVYFMAYDPYTVGWQGLYFFQTIINTQPASVLNYCYITHGEAVDGGGINCYYAEIELNNCNIYNNSATSDGGGIYASFSTLTLNNTTIEDNYANQSGGIDCHQSNTMDLTNVDIINNDAEQTGGMSIDWSSIVTMTNVLIDNNTSHGYGGGLYIGTNSDVTFDTVTISNNNADIGEGGGMYLYQTVTLTSPGSVTISDNSAGYGGGIVCYNDCSPNIFDYQIHDNFANWYGGGVYCYSNSSPEINSLIYDNESGNSGGGVYIYESAPLLNDSEITENTAGVKGGGIYSYNSNFILYDSLVEDNTSADAGGGLYLGYNSYPSLESSTIINNRSIKGGGIYFDSSAGANFNMFARCDLYSNIGASGNDLYSYGGSTPIEVYVDYFTVANPNDYFAHPIGDFIFSILNSIETQVAADLYVSSFDGSDLNSGLDAGNPLKTITKAMTKIEADAGNPRTIYLAGGTYSNGFSAETYPLNCKDFVTISGSNRENTWLDAEDNSTVLYLDGDESVTLENLTVMNGSATYGGGVYCSDYSDLTMQTAYVRDNYASEGGGVIYCAWDSNLDLSNVDIYDNNSDIFGGGIEVTISSSITMNNGNIYSNTAGNGGGLYLSVLIAELNNVNIYENTADSGGGIYAEMCMTTTLTACVICDNIANFEGDGIYIFGDMMPFTIDMIDCIVCDEIYEFSPYLGRYDFINATYCNIAGGCEGVGNIDVDPEFIDPDNGNYHLSPTSLCVDAGNPDPAYNDPEDPENPGYALFPALGTITADMGSYGGPGADDWDEPEATPPSAPDNVTITITYNGAFIQWDAVPEATSYNIYVADANDPYGTYSLLDNTTETDWTEAVGANEKRFYYVTAVN
ncbi:MAG TPA: hypothetical protein ENL20_13075 [Candidatus Cloacimonetes bacterium]|nr:hypothetical protein [Candidatus Cloacimonadota bacterium]